MIGCTPLAVCRALASSHDAGFLGRYQQINGGCLPTPFSTNAYRPEIGPGQFGEE
jgi:hypothetical protein